jgi:hypothetical protein
MADMNNILYVAQTAFVFLTFTWYLLVVAISPIQGHATGHSDLKSAAGLNPKYSTERKCATT